MSQCSVHITPDGNIKSCLSLQALKRIAESYNEKKGKPIIKYKSNTTKEELWKTIRKEMHAVCKSDDEVCWINKSGADNGGAMIMDHFKPKKPKGKYTWLSNVDIELLMRGYQKKHKDFRFFGPVPSDFDKIITELNGKNLKLMPDVRRVAIITNLDPHYKGGSHWTAFFMDLDARSIEYFDSVGEPPFPTMDTYMKNLKAWLKINMNLDTKIKINNKVFQKKYDGDCGIWSCWYIIQRLGGRSFEEVIDSDFAEEALNKCRDVYFRV